MTFSTDSQRRLIWHGMYLFLLDLLIGFADGQVTNPRMGLAAHLEGLMNGTCLIALGAVWQFVRCLLQSRPGHIGPHRMGLTRTSSSQHSQRSLAQAAFHQSLGQATTRWHGRRV
jgi:hypothetical protein